MGTNETSSENPHVGPYRIVSLIRRGRAGATYLAHRAGTEGPAEASGPDAPPVVLKVLPIGELDDWKAVELMEREARVLRSIRHDRIPRYIDSFTEGEGGSLRYVLVQEHIEGVDLQERVERGWRTDEREITSIALRLFRILSYLHGLRPPVVHRDINPKNIVARETDGEIFLVDFGGVQDTIREAVDADATFVGTAGYTPLEQFMGRATRRSDLYAAAATVLFLLSQKNPSELPTRNMRIDLDACAEVSTNLRTVLESWLDPDESRRTLSPEDAVALLEGRTPHPAAAWARDSAGAMPRDLPYGSKIRLRSGPQGIDITVPERGHGPQSAALLGFGGFWLSFVGVWTSLAVGMGAQPFFALFSIPFWIVGLLVLSRGLYGLFGASRLRVSPSEGTFTFERRLLFLRRRTEVPLAHVGPCTITAAGTLDAAGGAGKPGLAARQSAGRTACRIEAGARSLSFGASLSDNEKEWLRDTINLALDQPARPPRGSHS